MANRQLVMLACKADHESPVIRVKPDFAGISVIGLGTGDEVLLLGANGAQHQMQLREGLSPFPKIDGLTHFTIIKRAGSEPAPTTVEVLRGS